ncbi:hypothetical protein RIF29_15496 [Crotalaria pallida]|uniref:Uncharacterized protein n=1 Tax=Crotalaria pallida TaxID=3830 RepID=A0AAN9FJ68_CROPI
MVEEALEETLTRLEEAKTPLRAIFHGVIQAGLIELKEEVEILDLKEGSCIFHGSKDHSIETCTEVKMLIQKLMDSGFIQISKQIKIGDVNMVEGSTSKPKVVPVLQLFKGEPCFQRFEPSLAPIPTPFPYLNSKAVPWKYAEITQPRKDVPEISNITGLGGITRSDRVYLPQGKRDGPDSSKIKIPTVDEKEPTHEKDIEKLTNENLVNPRHEKQKSGTEIRWILPRPPGFELNNWEVTEFPKIVLSPVSMSSVSM